MLDTVERTFRILEILSDLTVIRVSLGVDNQLRVSNTIVYLRDTICTVGHTKGVQYAKSIMYDHN